MNDKQNELPASEVSRRIVTVMKMSYELYDELVGFLRMLQDCLESSDLELNLIAGGSSYALPREPRKTRGEADNYMKTDLGIVYETGVSSVVDEEEDDEKRDAELDKRGLAITADSQFLAIRVHLYDRNAPDPDAFQPTVFAALLDDVTKTSRSKKGPGTGSRQFTVARNQFLVIVKKIDSGIPEGQVLTRPITKGILNLKVSRIVSRALTDFTSETQVQEFVDQIVQMASE